MPDGRELFLAFLEGRPLSRPAFVPLVRGLAGRVGGTAVEVFTSDPTLWANLLVKTADLFGFDGVVAGLDFSLLAEACGCRIAWRDDRPKIQALPEEICDTPEDAARLKVALEKAQRVFEVSRSKRACVAALTGPVTLAEQILGREEGPHRLAEIKHLAVRAAEAFCRTRPDVLIFLEGRPLARTEIKLAHRKVYNTLKNIAAHYDVPVGLYLQGYEVENLNSLHTLKMDFHVLGPAHDGSLPPLADLWDLAEGNLGLGIGLPLNDLEAAKKVIREGAAIYRAKAGKGFFFTSAGPATRDVDLETLHKLVKEIGDIHL